MYKTEAMKRFDIISPQKATRLIPTTVEGVCDRIKSKSYISVLPLEKQEEISQAIRQLFKTKSDEELQRTWIDKEKGIFAYPYSTGEFVSSASQRSQVLKDYCTQDLFLFRKK